MEVNLETTGKLREYILNIQKPAVLKNILNSQLISWDLDQWQKELGSDLLKFRCGRNQFTQNPQWESTCSTKYSNFTEFLESAKSNSHEWWYFDYKHLNQWLLNKENIQNNITWTNLGFPELNQSHSTIWIGSKGAHTPCHVDTYGCNIVLQVFGRKQWLLFPPEENLKPARIPFEESSIYSKLNFFSPQINKFKGVFHCHKVTLNPGEILVVPNKWWHYVENLETAISVNAWIPLPQDDFERVKEGIASIFIGKALEHKNQMKEILLNPNMVEVNLMQCNFKTYTDMQQSVPMW
ncbi:hypothetical protein ABEB36_011071 [Hypothenemus hampei]|uniref:JmjC domain-containing protein n=1 Tax=Hypothenemus hampei TaxID=57062 RepID=A0ABD1EER2_HYPHA